MQNILDCYTLETGNRFLREIDKLRLKERMDRIYEVRVAGAPEQNFKQIMRQMRGQERAMERAQAKQEGRKPMYQLTQQETQALQAQGHARFSELDASEQSVIKSQLDSMWATVPAHVRDKAQKLQGR